MSTLIAKYLRRRRNERGHEPDHANTARRARGSISPMSRGAVALRETGVTQRQLADLAGCSDYSVSKYLSGKTLPPETFITALRELVGSDRALDVLAAAIAGHRQLRETRRAPVRGAALVLQKAGATQDELADLLGCDRSTVGGYLRGEHRPPRDFFDVLAVLVGADQARRVIRTIPRVQR